jgi:membrane-bound serine protease (ClpP class)
VGEFTGVLDLLGALMRLLGIEENALMPAIALLVVFFIIAVPVGLLAQGRRVRTGQAGLVGEVGTVATDIAPAGKVYVHSEYWNAVAGETIPAGSVVRVVAVDGMTIRVERVK